MPEVEGAEGAEDLAEAYTKGSIVAASADAGRIGCRELREIWRLKDAVPRRRGFVSYHMDNF